MVQLSENPTFERFGSDFRQKKRLKPKHFRSDFGILLVPTKFGTERLSPVRNLGFRRFTVYPFQTNKRDTTPKKLPRVRWLTLRPTPSFSLLSESFAHEETIKASCWSSCQQKRSSPASRRPGSPGTLRGNKRPAQVESTLTQGKQLSFNLCTLFNKLRLLNQQLANSFEKSIII